MCILSVSLEIPSPLSSSALSSPSIVSPTLSSSSPCPSFTSRHRRSLSDTFIFHKLNKLNTSSSLSIISPSLTRSFINTPSPSFSKKTSIPPPPPLPSPLYCSSSSLYSSLSDRKPKYSISLKESIAKYNVYDNNNDNDILSPAPSSSSSPSSSSVSSPDSYSSSSSSSSTSNSLYSSNGASSSSSPASPAPSLPSQCPVCFEDTIPTDFLYFLPCLHPYCKDCVQEHLKALVSMGQKLTCMSPNCKSVMPPVVAKPLMDKATYKRYKLLQKTPAGAHRWCPRPGCDTPYIKEDVNSFTPKVTCKNPACNLAFCYECRITLGSTRRTHFGGPQ